MVNKQIKLLLWVNSYIFPFLVVFTYAFVLLESYFYIGVLRRFILLDSRFFVALAVFCGFLALYNKLKYLSLAVLKVNYLVFVVSAILYIVMQILESGHFHNYVFSRYHFQPGNFFYLVVLSAGLVLVHKMIKVRRLNIKISFVGLGMAMVFLLVFLDGFAKTVDAAVYSDIYIARHLTASYDFKMRESWGIYYDYIKFVKEVTPSGAVILIPPQETPWLSTGNAGLDRYFLFPRRLVNGSYTTLADPGKYDYVMFVWGEWNDAPKERYGWPKVAVSAEKVVYFDPETGKIAEISGDYDPKASLKGGAWGIIKVKK